MSMNITSIGTASPSFFGTGFTFPIQLDSTQSKISVSSDEALIRQSMDSIINTDISERPFLLKNGIPFGTRIKRALFAPTDIAINIVQYECTRALTVWEPRIVVNGTTASSAIVSDGGSAIVAVVSFVFRNTNRSDNFVVPFLLTSPDTP